MKLLVTGGAGFIGSNFVRMAFNGGLEGITEVTVIDKLTYAGNLRNLESVQNLPNFSFIHGDICDYDLVSSLLKGKDAVVNFAAESHVDRSIESSIEFVKTNIVGTHTLLQAALANQVGKFLQVSTDEVYGSIPEGSWDENCPLLPNSPYSASKASADLLVRSFNKTHGLHTLITRCSNNYGPYQFPEKAIPLFVKKLLNNENIPIYGSGSNIRDWLHIDDHCRGIFQVLKKGMSGEVYNIGGGVELTNLELASKILNILDLSSDRIDYVQDRFGHDQRYSVDWSKIATLGYEPHVNFADGLERTVLTFANDFQGESNV